MSVCEISPRQVDSSVKNKLHSQTTQALINIRICRQSLQLLPMLIYFQFISKKCQKVELL